MKGRFTIFRKGLAILALALLFQVAFVWLISKMQETQQEAQRWSLHSKEVLAQVHTVARGLLQVHNGFRGNVLADDVNFSTLYVRAAAEVPPALAELRQLVSDNPDQVRRAEQIDSAATAFLNWVTANTRLLAAGERGSVHARIRSGEGERKMDALQAELLTFEDEEHRLDQERSAALQHGNELQSRLLWVGTAAAIVLVLVLGFLFHKGISARLATLTANAGRLAQGVPLEAPVGGTDEIARLDGAFHDMAQTLAESQQAMREQTQILQAILESMADGVVVADERGKFLVFNPAAARILGHGATSAPPEDWPRVYGAFRADGVTPLPAADQPLVRAMRGESTEEVELFLRNPNVPEGTYIRITGRPLRVVGQDCGGVVVLRDVTERKKAEDTIRRLNEDLEERVQQRTMELVAVNRDLGQKNQENEMFVYSVSHDLRSPLVNLEGFSKELTGTGEDLRELLSRAGVPPDVREAGLAMLDGSMAESIHFIQSAVQRLSGIIDALLRLSRAGRVEYQPQPVEVPALLNRILAALHATIAQRGADVTLGELPTVWGDPVALEAVFANLIGNALNYLDPGRPGRIEVSSARDTRDGTITYVVRDNGRGIPKEYLPKVFRAFQRLHPEAAPGEGMGLAIVRRIVERHHGKVWVESEPGVGTTFYVALPGTWPEKAIIKSRGSGVTLRGVEAGAVSS